MTHFPETKAALHRLATAIKIAVVDLFKSPSQRYAELAQNPEYVSLMREAVRQRRAERDEKETRRLLEEHGIGEADPNIDHSSSPWWTGREHELRF